MGCRILNKINSRDLEVTGLLLPALMYAKGAFDPDNIGIGLCRGHILLRVRNFLICGTVLIWISGLPLYFYQP